MNLIWITMVKVSIPKRVTCFDSLLTAIQSTRKSSSVYVLTTKVYDGLRFDLVCILGILLIMRVADL